MAWSPFRSNAVMFLCTVAAFIVVRNMFFTFVTDSIAINEYYQGVELISIGGLTDSQKEIRKFTLPKVDSKPKSNVSRVLNETIVYREKSDKNHTLLKANMSHVNEIVKKLKAAPLNLENVPNPHPFKYIINSPNICGKDSVYILVYIHTAPDHHKRRTVIRQTWGKISQYDIPMRLVFVMGLTSLDKNVSSSSIQQALNLESEQYGDIIQEDFLDTYHNLTYKGIAALKWIENYCSQATYILKTDDDIFVNTYSLIRHLKHMEKNPNNTRGLIMCAVWYGMQVMRTGKWKVTVEEWPNDTYPTYCSGSAFVLTTDVAVALHRVSYHVPFFWVDDFYITGLLPLKANITHRQFHSTYALNGDRLEELFTGAQWYLYIFSHVHDLNRIQSVWTKMSRLAKGVAPIEIKIAKPGELSNVEKKDDLF